MKLILLQKRLRDCKRKDNSLKQHLKVKLFNIIGDVTLVVRDDFEGPNISLLGLDLLDNKFNYRSQ